MSRVSLQRARGALVGAARARLLGLGGPIAGLVWAFVALRWVRRRLGGTPPRGRVDLAKGPVVLRLRGRS